MGEINAEQLWLMGILNDLSDVAAEIDRLMKVIKGGIGENK